MADKYTPNKAPNGNTYLRDWWNKVVETNFSTIFQVFSKHIVGSGDRHTADTVDFDSETTVEEKINTEIADRENGDKELESLINSLITTEATERKENDDLKANMTDVLTKDNTTAYSPTKSYHPATKKYVDDIAINSGAGDMLTSVYDMNGNGIVDNAEKLGGYAPSYFASQAFVNSEISNLENQLNTPPELTEVSPDGTAIGTGNWTGTGFVCTAANTKYAITSANVFGGLLGFNRFCLRFADPSGNKWKSWSPWLDVDGVSYEFFYSPARKLYEALIPATTLNAEEIVSLIRWERAEPDIVRYGKVSNMFGSTTVVSDDGTETTTYSMHTEEGSLRDCCGNYIDADTQVGMAFFSGDITLPTENIPQSIFVKLYLSLDTNCDGSFKAQDVTAIGRKVKGAAAFTIETIDNFA